MKNSTILITFFLLANVFITLPQQNNPSGYPSVKPGKSSFQLVPLSFFQINAPLTYFSDSTPYLPCKNDLNCTGIEDDNENANCENTFHQYPLPLFVNTNDKCCNELFKFPLGHSYFSCANTYGCSLKIWSVRSGNSAIF